MGKFINLEGKKFGKLTIIGKKGSRITPNGTSKVLWECLCECGNVVIVLSESLRNNNTKSCGCYNKERVTEAKVIDLRGKFFGKLIVLDRDFSHKKAVKWLCKCECGSEVSVLSNSLITGKTKSCGCYRRETLFNDLTNNVFNDILVLNYYGKTKGNGSLWKCKCFCGEIFVTSGQSLKSGNTKSCGCLSESSIAHHLKTYCRNKYNSTTEYKIVKSPKTNWYLPYDIYIPKGADKSTNGIYIEIQGAQHYEKNRFFDRTDEDFKYQKYKDKIKKVFAKNNGTYIEVDLRKVKNIDQAIDYIETIIDKC